MNALEARDVVRSRVLSLISSAPAKKSELSHYISYHTTFAMVPINLCIANTSILPLYKNILLPAIHRASRV